MYKRKSYDLGDIREVMEYHNGRYLSLIHI